MSELVIFGTQEETGAAEMRISVQRLQEKGKMLCEDAAIVERHADNSVEFKVVKKLVSKGILGEGFWGALVQAIPRVA